MRTNVKIIKLTAWLSFLLAIVTYFVSIKQCFGMQECKWLPDSFLLTVFGGAFASTLIVLICEISKYFHNKEAMETYLFSHLYYLYAQLQVISKNIAFFDTQEDHVPKNALSQLIANAESEMNTVYYADYAPYKESNSVLRIKKRFNENGFFIVRQFLQNCGMLEIAVLTDEINRVQRKMGVNKEQSNNTHLVLIKLSDEIQRPLDSIDTILADFDQICSGRYQWLQIKDSLIKGIPDNRTDMLEQFLSKNSSQSP